MEAIHTTTKLRSECAKVHDGLVVKPDECEHPSPKNTHHVRQAVCRSSPDRQVVSLHEWGKTSVDQLCYAGVDGDGPSRHRNRVRAREQRPLHGSESNAEIKG
jgi:hypothetical protein